MHSIMHLAATSLYASGVRQLSSRLDWFLVVTAGGHVAVQAGLADIKGWGQYMGAQWCGEGTDIERALEHSNQAVRYLISGKDDCVRKACKVTPKLHYCGAGVAVHC